MTQIEPISPAQIVKHPRLHGPSSPQSLVFLIRCCLEEHRKLIDAIVANQSRVLQEHQAAHLEKRKKEHLIKV